MCFVGPDLRLQFIVERSLPTFEQRVGRFDEIVADADQFLRQLDPPLRDEYIVKSHADIASHALFLRVKLKVRRIGFLAGDFLIELQLARRNESLADESTLTACRSQIADFGGVISHHRIGRTSRLKLPPGGDLHSRRRRRQCWVVLEGDPFEVGKRHFFGRVVVFQCQHGLGIRLFEMDERCFFIRCWLNLCIARFIRQPFRHRRPYRRRRPTATGR